MDSKVIKIEYLVRQIFFGSNNAKKWLGPKILNRYGLNALSKFDEIIRKHDKKYWLCFGTLLGAYREHTFIKHDDDIDIGMFDVDITVPLIEDLIEAGFTFRYVFVENHYKGIHVSFYYKDLTFDIYSFHLSEDRKNMLGFVVWASDNDWNKISIMGRANVYRVRVPYKGVKDISFMGLKLMVPQNDEELLKTLYGESFMTPIPGYKAKPNNNVYNEDPRECYADIFQLAYFADLKKSGKI